MAGAQKPRPQSFLEKPMTVHVNQASVAISASTTSASAAIPAEFTQRYIRVVNPTAALCYVTTTKGAGTATSSFPAVAPSDKEIFEKPADHDTVSVLLSTGTGTISVTPCSSSG